ncbi:MAG: hypothetical protein AAB932_03595 [Patescibacteria group bacterium]
MKYQGRKIGSIIGAVIAGFLLGLTFFCLSKYKMESGFICIFPLLPSVGLLETLKNQFLGGQVYRTWSIGFYIFHFGFYMLIGWCIGWIVDAIRSKKQHP